MKAIIQKYIWAIVALIFVLSILSAVGITYRLTDLVWQNNWNERELQISKAENEALKEKSAIEAKWQAKADQIREEGKKNEDVARNDASSANDAIDRLRQRVNKILADAAANDSGSPARGKTATEAVNLLSDMLWKSIERNRQLSEYADRAGNAGAVCEKYYDAIATKK